MPHASPTKHYHLFSREKLIILMSLMIISSVDAFTSENFFSFSIAWIILLSAIFYDYVPFKCHRSNFFKMIFWIKHYYFFTISLLFLFTLVFFPRKQDYEKCLTIADGLRIATSTIFLMKILEPIFSKFFLILSVNVMLIYCFQLQLQFIVEIICLMGIYLLHLFSKIKEKKGGPQAKNKFWKKKKISNEAQEFLNLIFLNCSERKFILDKNLKFLYDDESRVIEPERKNENLNCFLKDMGGYEYKIRREGHEICFSEFEIIKEISRSDQNDLCPISFQELIRCTFNERFARVCLLVECNLKEEQHEFIYIMRQNGKAFFKFISKDFEVLINEKNEMIQRYAKTISFVSHEFRTPLNCIINMLQAMQHIVDNELISNFIVPSLISSKFLLNLVNDLLDIAQLDAGKFKLVFLEFNLSALLEDTLQIISFQAINRKIELELKIDKEIIMIKSDPNRVRQIITNLLSNALKYSTSGGIITLRAYRCQTHEIEISVKDSGLGIKQENLSKLFKEFSKITDKQNLALNSQGIGLGLVISNKISHQLNEINGGINVESELGKGSVFSFKIIDHAILENECLMTTSNHIIENIFKMECRLIHGLPTINNDNESIMILHKNSQASFNDIPNFLDRKHQKKLSGSIGNNTSKESKIIFGGLSMEKSLKSNSSKHLSKSHFFFAEAGTFKNFTSHEDFKQKEVFIEKKKEFIINYMHRKCSCPFILAVDDNDFNNLTMTMHARRLEIPIITALSACEGLQKIREQEDNSCCSHFKLILMDIEMPVMDGIEAFQIIKALYEEKKRKLCIVGVTGHVEGSEKLEKVKQVMGDAIVKPISFEYLVLFLDRFIKDLMIRENK